MSHVPVSVTYCPTTHGITFKGPTVIAGEKGARALIKVARKLGEESEIVLNLSGGKAFFPASDQAVQWNDGQQPSWVPGIERSSATMIQISDNWQGQSDKAAGFTVSVIDDGEIYSSADPTIINNPDNGST